MEERMISGLSSVAIAFMAGLITHYGATSNTAWTGFGLALMLAAFFVQLASLCCDK